MPNTITLSNTGRNGIQFGGRNGVRGRGGNSGVSDIPVYNSGIHTLKFAGDASIARMTGTLADAASFGATPNGNEWAFRTVNYSTSGLVGQNRFIVKNTTDGSRMIINR